MRKPIRATPPPGVKKTVLPVPMKILQEFVGYGEYNLRAVNKCGPKSQNLHCTASWAVVLDEVEQARFQVVASEVGNVKRLYHGTAARNISAITREGLRMGGAYCMFGRGIYFGHPRKAMGYARLEGNKQGRYLLEADVALGVSLVPPKAGKYTLAKLRADGFSSVHGKAQTTGSWGGTLAFDEWVVYSTEQVKLLYVHEYQEQVQVEAPPPSHSCQRVSIQTEPLLPRNRAFRDVLTKPRACGATTYTVVKITGGGEVWVCPSCLEKHHIRVGDKFQVLERGRLKTVKVKG